MHTNKAKKKKIPKGSEEDELTHFEAPFTRQRFQVFHLEFDHYYSLLCFVMCLLVWFHDKNNQQHPQVALQANENVFNSSAVLVEKRLILEML